MLRQATFFVFTVLLTCLTAAPSQLVFVPFTGKVLGNKVRVRVQPDLESHVVRQLNKNDLVLVVSETDQFFAVAPFKDMKAFIFRSYILDGVVEANRVNVRLEPRIDAPILGQLQAGDKVDGQVFTLDRKWLQISPPTNTKLYIAKDLVERVGDAGHLAAMQQRQEEVERLLSDAFAFGEIECQKSYEEMDLQTGTTLFQKVIKNYLDFPEKVIRAKEGLALLKETYLQRKIKFLEERDQLSEEARETLLSKHLDETKELSLPKAPSATFWKLGQHEMTEAMRPWTTVEESLFLNWATFHTDKTIDNFYAEQSANAVVLIGSLEAYPHEVKNRPGDFLLRREGLPLAYLYSTKVDLSRHTHQPVVITAAPRPNHHFAFPAYFVIDVQQGE
jgi:hypothetical protein